MAELRYFTPEGRARWSAWLDELRLNPSLPFPEGILENRDLTRAAPGGITVVARVHESRFDLAQELAPAISQLRLDRFPADRWPGVWDWLAALYFDSICPADASGRRALREKARYSFSPESFGRRYRHRIHGPVEMFLRFGDAARLFLHGDPATVTDWEEQAAGRYQISANRAIAEALFQLYWDPARLSPRRGAAPNKKDPGTLRRFSDVVQQFDRTYDLVSIGANDIIQLLPREFDRFRRRDEPRSA